jgi:hypothetical protein
MKNRKSKCFNLNVLDSTDNFKFEMSYYLFFVLIALKATLPTSNAHSETRASRCKNCKKHWPVEVFKKKICLDNTKI